MDAAELPQLDLGTIRLRWLHGGVFRMDGAAVFGQLPRPVWSTLLAPDEDNRVGLVARVLLVETGDELGLMEAGHPHTLASRQRTSLVVVFSNARHVVQRREVEEASTIPSTLGTTRFRLTVSRCCWRQGWSSRWMEKRRSPRASAWCAQAGIRQGTRR